MATNPKKVPTYAERVEASRTELTEALTEETAARHALEAAQEAVAAMRQGRRGGDKSATATDLATARAQVSLCEDDVAYAESRLKRARRDLLNDDTSLADALAGVLGGLAAFSSVEIVPTAESPAMPSAVSRPRLTLVQTEAAIHDTVTGRTGGAVEAYFHRPSWGLPLDTEDLAEALARVQIYADVQSLGVRKAVDVCEDRARFTVRGLWHSVPVIANPNGAAIFGQTLAGRVAAHLSIGRRGEVKMAREGGLGSTTALSAAVAGQGEARMVNVAEKGSERTVTVEATIALRSATVGNGLLGSEASDYLRSLIGGCEAGLGRIEGVTLVPEYDTSKRADAPLRIKARFAFLSRTA